MSDIGTPPIKLEAVFNVVSEKIISPSFDVRTKRFSPEIDTGRMLPFYTGDYIVTPKVEQETELQTKNKSMSDNVVVLPIPCSDVDNPFGGRTITIG